MKVSLPLIAFLAIIVPVLSITIVSLYLSYVPLGLAIFIAGTRFVDFRNHGVDTIAGVASRTAMASFAFQRYDNGFTTQ